MPTVSTDQNPVVTESTPVLQEWAFSPPSYSLDYYQGEALPAAIVVQTTFKDILSTPAAYGKSNFTYRTYIGQALNLPLVAFMQGDYYTGEYAYAAYANGLHGEMLYLFDNVDTMAIGVYNYKCYHQIWGKTLAGVNTLITEKIFNLRIRIFSATAPTFSPNPIYINWIMGSTVPINAAPFTITGENWNIKSPAGFLFQSVPGATLIQPTDWEGADLSATGAKTVTMGMFPYAAPDEITENPLTFYLEVNGGILMIPIIVNLLQGSGLFLGSDHLHFIAFKGIANAPSQYMQVWWSSFYKFTGPPWLTVDPISTNGNQEITFDVLSANNMEVGVYEAPVTVKSVPGGVVLGTINVIYEVVGAVINPYPLGGLAFTLDRKFLEFVSEMDNTYFDLAINARLYEFYTGNHKDVTYNFKVVLYNRKAEFNIGLIIDRLMYRMPDFLTESDFPYKKAEVSLDITERSTVDAAYAETYHIPGFTFVAGIQPVIKKGCGFLDLNTGASRVTATSYTYLNFVASYFQLVQIFKNGEVINSYQTYGGINSRKINLQDWDAAQGDVFEYRIATSEGNISKIFKVFPDGYDSNYIVWENEYKLKSVIEFTGKYTVTSEFEHKTQTLFERLVTVLTKFDSAKTTKLAINTGWLLKSDAPSVESLIRAKRAALVINGKAINLVPTGKKLINSDSDDTLISFDVEFDINRSYNEEIYTF